RSAEIRLKNSRPDPLKRATEALVDDLMDSSSRSQLGSLAFAQIPVLEPNSSAEAFHGAVQGGKSLHATLRERSADLKVAAVFLLLGMACLLVISPLATNLDFRLRN